MQSAQREISEDAPISFVLFLAVVGLLSLLVVYQRVVSKRRLQAVRKRSSQDIPLDQIIVAWELEGVLVEISYSKAPGFKELKIDETGVEWCLSKVRKILGRGIFFRPILPKKEIKSLLKTLHINPKVELHLYTSLPLPIADLLLINLGLDSLFDNSNRLSCLSLTCTGLKHPTAVDFNTKRVIIITGNRKDHLEEDSQYFLVVKGETLYESVRSLEKVVMNNRQIDELHSELADLKVYLESDFESGAE